MVNLLYTECLKLKNSSMFIASVVGAAATPLLCFIGFLETRAQHPGTVITFDGCFDETNFYITMLLGIPLYGVITIYLFNREYSENTLRNLLTLPVSKFQYLISKLLILLIWMAVLTLIAWLLTLVLGLFGGFTELTAPILLKWLKIYMLGGFLLFLATPPIIFVTLVFKDFLPSVVFTIILVMGNVLVHTTEYRAIYPWSAPIVIAEGLFTPRYPVEYTYYSLGLVSLLGFAAMMVYFLRTDIE